MFFNHYDLEKMVPMDHELRRMRELLAVEGISGKREEWKKCLGREGYGMEVGLRALFLQFYGDHSDREMEEHLKYNYLYRWFCGFTLESKTPDHTYLCRVRKNLGADRVGELFARITDDALDRKIIKKLRSFVDSSAIRRKEAEWAKRDAERSKEESVLEGQSANSADRVKQYSADTEARWGCKGKKKFWFGYKRHVSVDTGSGLIEKVAVTPANVHDSDAFLLVCPEGKEVVADKAYDTWKVRAVMERRLCQDGVLRTVRRKDFDAERNKRLSRKRSPWEHVFSKVNKRTRYMGLAKTRLQALMEAIVFNLKRLVVLEGPTPSLIGTA